MNLAEVATAFSGKAQTASHYKRLQRFFRQFELDYYTITGCVAKTGSGPDRKGSRFDRQTAPEEQGHELDTSWQ